MNCKCAHFWGAISLLSVFLTTQVISAPYNGRFELYEYNSVLDINVPTGWQYENYTAVLNRLIPQPRGGGSTENWLLDANVGLSPHDGNYFLVLRTGDGVSGQYPQVQQTITIEAEDTLIGAYFFGTCDYPSYNDYGEITLIPLDPNDSNLSQINILRVSVSDVGKYGSMKGWERFEYTFNANQAGTYNLLVKATDVVDWIYRSYFAVDGLVLCEDASSGGDINLDCTTDFHDFALLATDWLRDCNAPNNCNDPNTNCQLDTDLTGDGPVDTKDLQIMSEYWLEGTKE
jgi:hypothetical protein